MTQAPALSIIIVNWKSADFLRKCLKSIFANASGLSFEILVVDNASFDGSAELVEREFPGVRFLQSTENLGFAGANNLGVRHSRGRALLFLNPDTEILVSALQTLCFFLDSNLDAGLVGAKLLNSDLTVQVTCIKAFPSILNQTIDSQHLKTTFPTWPIWGMKPLFVPDLEFSEVEVVSGACMLVRRDLFEEVGGFSTDYFMYSEDVDLCHKVKQAAWRVYYAATATIIHHGGKSAASQAKQNFETILLRQSQFCFMRKRRGKFYATAFRATMGVNALARIFVMGAGLLLTVGLCSADSLHAALTKWTKTLRWSIGLERWAEELSRENSSRRNDLGLTGQGS